MRTYFGDIPSVMLPYENKPLIEKQYLEYESLFDEIYLLVDEGKELIKNFIVTKKDFKKLKLVEISNSESITDSILNLKAKVKSNGLTSISILYGDTFIFRTEFEAKLNSEFFSLGEVNESYTWTILLDKNLVDKKHVNSNPPFYALTGLFNFIDSNSLFSELEKVTFYTFLQDKINKNQIKPLFIKDWIDLGHYDNLLRFKNKFQSRFFNTILIDREKGILTKKSSNLEKFILEINWYIHLPKNLNYLIPRVFDYNSDGSNSFIRMEFYSYTTLHELYLFSNFNYLKWKLIFEVLIARLKELHSYKKKFSKRIIQKNIKSMYLSKVIHRFDQIDNVFLKKIIKSGFTLNNTKFISLDDLFIKLKNMYKILNFESLSYFNIIHGDYFFSNILYDVQNDLVRLIDPRGSFGVVKMFGDHRYDYAKLLHSVHGYYDLIIEDKFSIKNLGLNEFEFKVHSNESHAIAFKAYINTLKENDICMKELKFIEITLFFSMIPLHADSSERQKAMFFQALLLLNELEKEM